MRFNVLTFVLLIALTVLSVFVVAESADSGNFVEVDAYNEAPLSPCPTGCSNHGVCTQDGQCVCFDGWGGSTCATASCPEACSLHGNCVDGVCHCRPGWVGYDCSYRGCTDNCSGHGSCHISPFVSECTCFPGYVGDKCDQVDPMYIAAAVAPTGCIDDCNGNGLCAIGECKCKDGFSGSACEQRVCKDNCHGRGFCDTKTGVCKCLDTAKFTGDSCETVACPSNCSNHGVCLPSGLCKCDTGYFGRDCAPENCEAGCNFPNGKCEVPAPKTINGTAVIDPRAGEPRGTCKCSPFFGGSACAERRCADDCSGHGVCDEATFTCTCNDGWDGVACNLKPCDETCVHGTCFEGKCVCEPEYSGSDCNTRIACPNHCNNKGSCRAGKCFCQSGFYGADCSLTVGSEVPSAPLRARDGSTVPPGQKTCSPACVEGQGICIVQGRNDPVCRCVNGYKGVDCGELDMDFHANDTSNAASFVDAGKQRETIKLPPAGQAQCLPSCGLGGRCIELDGKLQCVCTRGWFGPTCEVRLQAPVSAVNATKHANSTQSTNSTSAAAPAEGSAGKDKAVSLMETRSSLMAPAPYYDQEAVYELEEDQYEDEMLLRALDQIISV